MSHNISRNSKCPCGSGLKYKKCCLGKIDWNSGESYKPQNFYKNLSIRGKNLQLIKIVADALQLDNLEEPSMEKLKQTCTTSAIRSIYESIVNLWPDANDLNRIYNEISPLTTGFYTGNYYPYSILKGVMRHTFYTDKILLVEPFHDPRHFRDKYNPIVHPENHIENTLMGIRFLFSLSPWLDRGLVNFIRTPSSFDLQLHIDCMKSAEQRIKKYPHLEVLLNESSFDKDQKREMVDYYFLAQPDFKIKELLLEYDPNVSTTDIEAYLSYVEKMRANHPYFVPFISEKSQQVRQPLLAFGSGANYDLTKIISSLTDSHVITDIRFRWEELNVDRKEGNITLGPWDGFAKAFQEVNLQFLNDVPLKAALTLRCGEHLENFRVFLNRLWRNIKLEDELDDKNAKILKDELYHHIKEAEIEWQNIDGVLLKWFGIKSIAAIGALGSPIASGNVDILLTSFVGASIINLISAQQKRKQFKIKYPAGFFLDLKRNA